jgi:hypothetical protein
MPAGVNPLLRAVGVAALLLLALARPAQAQEDLTGTPGYIDFSEFESWFDEEASVEVNLQGRLLGLIAEASRADDPELADLLLKLKALQVRGFPLTAAQIRTMERRAADIGDDLEADGWTTVVRLRDYDRYVDMYARESETAIEGLLMMVVDAQKHETVFINIVGDIDPAELGRIGRKFDIGPLDDVK